MNHSRRTWAEVDLDRIVENFQTMRSFLNGAKTMATVKADAYGHGDIAVARALEKAGADWFAVSNFEEAVLLRRQGVTRSILILGYTPPECAVELAGCDVTQAVYSIEYAAALSEAAVRGGVRVDCHIKLDTGMTRLGFYAQNGHEEQAVQEVTAALRLPQIDCSGIFTHFACADEIDADSKTYTRMQFAVFQKTISLLETQGIRFALRHCCNSAGTMCFPEMHLDLVRLGVVLYGLDPSPDCIGLAKLQPAMSLYSTVTLVKEVEDGVPVSYGRTYFSEKQPLRIATVAVGYADGYRRSLSNCGRVLIRGRYGKVLGRVCMDQMMVDVTDIPGVRMGDKVTLVGKDGNKQISFDELAEQNHTIHYEEICLIGRRVPRVYLQGGREVGVADYLRQVLR